MTAARQNAIDEQNPWPGLDAFDEQSKRFFNGRETETATLLRLVLDSPLTILFGASGLGKTSLIQAGLFPILENQHFVPIKVKLDFRDNRTPFVEQLKSGFWEQLKIRQVDATPFDHEESLWHYLHRTDVELWSELNHLLTPVIVLDQFEEVFTAGAENPDSVAQFVVDLSDLDENRIPVPLANAIRANQKVAAGLSLESQPYRVLLSFREDFLPAFEGWKRLMPSILRSRLRLLPMSGEQAFRAVYETGKHLLDEPLARKIVQFVAAAQDSELIGRAPSLTYLGDERTVEPALLSLVCDGLNQKRQAQQKDKIDEELLTGTGQSIVRDFYEQSVRNLPERLPRFIENELITEKGYRKFCDVDDARTLHDVTRDDLRELENRRLVRVEPHHGTERVELIHDLLTPVVRELRDKQRRKDKLLKQQEERVQRRKQQRTIAAITLLLILTVSGILVAFFALNLVRAEKEVARKSKEIASKNEQIARSAQVENDRHNQLETATRLVQEGEHERYTGRYDEALQSFRTALLTYKALDTRKEQALAWISIGDVLAMQGKAADASKAYAQAQDISKPIGDPDLEGKLFESLGSLTERQKLTGAPTYYAKAIDQYQKAGDSQAAGRVLERLAFEFEKSKSMKEASSLYGEAEKNYSYSGDELGKLRVEQSLDRISPFIIGYWGILTHLITGEMFELKTDTVNVGRNVEGVTNEISFSDRLVSRRHLAINRDLHIDDMRSRNGTTVNAQLLPYGIGAKLSDGDTIVLAGVEPLLFSIKKPAGPLSRPANAWAILISTPKDFHYLTGPEYSLSIEGKSLILRPGTLDSAIVKLRRVDNKPEMFFPGEEWQFLTTQKETDYEYKSYVLKKDLWDELIPVPVDIVKLSADGKNIDVAGPSFQIVLLNSAISSAPQQ